MDILVITLDSAARLVFARLARCGVLVVVASRDTFFVTLDGVGQAIGGKDSTWTMNDMLVQP